MGANIYPAISVHRFSTCGIEARERHDAWRERPSSFGRLFETVPHEAFDTRSSFFSLGSIQVGFSTFCSQTWTRTTAMARADDVDWLTVNVRFAGAARGDSELADFAVPTGGTIMVDLAQPGSHFSERSDTALLMIPRALAESVFGPVRSLHGAVISPSGSALLRTHLRQLQQSVHDIPAAQGERMSGVLLDLIAVSLSMEGRPVAPTADAFDGAVRQRALAIIDARLGSAQLNPASLARSLGVSRSTLYRLFGADGGVNACIRQRRLEHVHQLLGQSTTSEPIAVLAERWGFCDAAHFGRLFRAAYGMTPGEYRAMRRALRAA
ncbi:helix-turn-helix domain-containing protein [Sphingomonas sp. BT-65]|uniref:helix-turn-helix domain-containing protein n=1 Tax=Sphingomonas sp. BT-65 TaxID=2989821 RepID=UPI0022359FAF|nr:helix-turn-helix domain-containing protein [Sphingomonas sp. BT-65]MCW4463291.1 helix-turn-helix domain-containing protein [Sphingomonas sp. BT-65]